MQELIWTVKPDLIIETGIAHGGSLIMSASMLALLDYSDAVNTNAHLNPKNSKRKVLGIDIDIRKHNEDAIMMHPMAHMITMMEGSSIDSNLVNKVKLEANKYETVLVFLDSNHTHQHVLEELKAYAPMVTMGSYCVVWDTGVEDLPEGFVKDRPWGKGDNPKTAVWEFLKLCGSDQILTNKGHVVNFEIDKILEHKLSITASPDGFLRRSR
jgi:cephalosporin hydroxylase